MRDAAGEHEASADSVLPLACTGVRIERAGRRLLDDVAISIGATGITAVLGPNGAGKSLLLRVLANLVTPDAGQVRWGAAPPCRKRAPRIGFVFQKPVLLRRSVRDNVAYALAATGVRGAARRTRVDAVLVLAALEHLAAMPARVLSGGEQQRVALARALVTAPEVLLLDEPTSSLDPASTLAIETLVAQASERGTRVVLVTHDLGQARRLADEVLFIHCGTVVERCEAKAFFAGPRSEAAGAFIQGKILL